MPLLGLSRHGLVVSTLTLAYFRVLFMKSNLPLILFFTLYCSGASAYIDPASGSAIISALISLLAALSFTIKTYWYRIVNFLRPTEHAGRQSDRHETLEGENSDESG